MTDYLQYLVAAIQENTRDMTGLECRVKNRKVRLDSSIPSGVAVVIGITGGKSGVIIVSTDRATAKNLGEKIYFGQPIEDEFVMDVMAEFTNIISGNTITKINNCESSLNLKIAPPSVAKGDNLRVLSPGVKADIIEIDVVVGQMVAGIGFEQE